MANQLKTPFNVVESGLNIHRILTVHQRIIVLYCIGLGHSRAILRISVPGCGTDLPPSFFCPVMHH